MKTRNQPQDLDEYLNARIRHNKIMSEICTRIAVRDPLAVETMRQRQIIDAALLSLTNGNTQKTRELLGEL